MQPDKRGCEITGLFEASFEEGFKFAEKHFGLVDAAFCAKG